MDDDRLQQMEIDELWEKVIINYLTTFLLLMLHFEGICRPEKSIYILLYWLAPRPSVPLHYNFAVHLKGFDCRFPLPVCSGTKLSLLHDQFASDLIRLLSFFYQLTRLEEEKLSLTKTVSELASSKETLSKEVEELLGKNQSLEKKLTSSKGQV